MHFIDRKKAIERAAIDNPALAKIGMRHKVVKTFYHTPNLEKIPCYMLQLVKIK